MPTSRYPRPGHPIVPQALGEFLRTERVTRFDHLDATAWGRLGEDACRELADQFLTELVHSASKLCDKLAGHRLQSEYGAIALDELDLQRRTLNCLMRAGIDELPSGRGSLTVGEVLQLRGFGVICLIDLMTSLEAYTAQQLKWRHASHKHNGYQVAEGDAAAKPSGLPAANRKLVTGISAIPGTQEISRDDPRLGPQLRDIALGASSLGALIESFHRGELSRIAAKDLAALCVTAQAMMDRSVVTEAIEVFGAGQPARDRQIVEACLQFRGRRRRPTYRSVAQRFGLTGERIRQVFCRRHWRPGRPRPFAPVLDRTLETIGSLAPSLAVDIERQLDREKLLPTGVRIEVVRELAGMLGREAGFVVDRRGRARSVIAEQDVKTTRKVQRRAREIVVRTGLATLKQLAPTVRSSDISPGAVTWALRSLDGFYWVNEAEGTFSLRGRQPNPIWYRIRKVLSVAPRVSIDTLWEALQHDNRPIRGGLTASQVLDFCRQHPRCHVSRNVVVARNPEDPLDVLEGHEREVVNFIMKHGPLCWRGKLMRLAARAGIEKPSFDKCLKSPAITRYATSVYGLTGADISASELAAFISNAPTAALPSGRS